MSERQACPTCHRPQARPEEAHDLTDQEAAPLCFREVETSRSWEACCEQPAPISDEALLARAYAAVVGLREWEDDEDLAMARDTVLHALRSVLDR